MKFVDKVGATTNISDWIERVWWVTCARDWRGTTCSVLSKLDKKSQVKHGCTRQNVRIDVPWKIKHIVTFSLLQDIPSYNIRGNNSRDILSKFSLTILARYTLRCYNCGEMGHMSKECAKEARPDKCFNCGEKGHHGKDCPKGDVPVCYTCGKSDHLSNACPQRPPGVCFNCNKEGHISKDCPEPLNIVCHLCKEKGHKAMHCPKGSSSSSSSRSRYSRASPPSHSHAHYADPYRVYDDPYSSRSRDSVSAAYPDPYAAVYASAMHHDPYGADPYGSSRHY